MDKKLLFILFILAFFLANSFAIDEFDIPSGDLDTALLEDTQKQAQENLLLTSQLSVKMDELGTSMVENLQVIADFTNQKINESQTNIIVIVILINLSTLGLWWAIYLFFQSKNLIVFPKKKPKEQEPKETDKPVGDLLLWNSKK